MIPTNALSPVTVSSAFEGKVARWSIPLVDYEMGAGALNDASLGMYYQQWMLSMDGDNFILTPEHGDPVVAYSVSGVHTCALAFDLNMQPVIAWETTAGTSLRYYDATSHQFIVIPIPNATQPKLCLDERRPEFLASSDVILAYMNGSDLCYRQQRENYGTERVLKTNAGTKLVAIGRSTANRLQFRMVP